MGRSEYAIIFVLVAVSVAALPAFRDVQAVESLFLTLCASIGLN